MLVLCLQVTANGVTVVDMRGLGGGGGGDSGRSSPGSGEQQVAVVQSGEGQHYIAVTGNTTKLTHLT